MQELMRVEVMSYSKPGEPPRPVTFRFNAGDVQYKGRVLKVLDKKSNKLMGNIMYEYLCDCVIDDHPSKIKISYEKDTMIWYLKNL